VGGVGWHFSGSHRGQGGQPAAGYELVNPGNYREGGGSWLRRFAACHRDAAAVRRGARPCCGPAGLHSVLVLPLLIPVGTPNCGGFLLGVPALRQASPAWPTSGLRGLVHRGAVGVEHDRKRCPQIPASGARVRPTGWHGHRPEGQGQLARVGEGLVRPCGPGRG
jgi:hypothetical protein